MNKIHMFLSGILIGTGVVLPGVSGSVIAILMGVYDYVIFLLNNQKIKIYNKFIKILPLIFGLLIGIIIFGNILLLLYDNFRYEMMYIFIGLILGEVPLLIKKVKLQGEQSINYSLLLMSILVSLMLVILPKILNFTNLNVFNPFNLFLAGFLYVSGKIIPGISSSLFLMILGLYEYILSILSNPFSLSLNQLICMIPFFIGAILSLLILVKVINILLTKYFTNTYSIIIGFVIGSVFAIYPGFTISIRGVISLLLMIISFFIVYNMSKKIKKFHRC